MSHARALSLTRKIKRASQRFFWRVTARLPPERFKKSGLVSLVSFFVSTEATAAVKARPESTTAGTLRLRVRQTCEEPAPQGLREIYGIFRGELHQPRHRRAPIFSHHLSFALSGRSGGSSTTHTAWIRSTPLSKPADPAALEQVLSTAVSESFSVLKLRVLGVARREREKKRQARETGRKNSTAQGTDLEAFRWQSPRGKLGGELLHRQRLCLCLRGHHLEDRKAWR